VESKTYAERFDDSLAANCAVRGIPEEEFGSVKAYIRKVFGKKPDEWLEEHELVRIQKVIESVMTGYLEGATIRPTVPDATDSKQGEATT